MSIVDLQDQRMRALQRAQESIAEMELLLASARAEGPRRLLKVLLKRLREQERCLAAGIIPRRAREN